MAYNRDQDGKGGGGRPFDIGDDFQNFLSAQPNVDPNNPDGNNPAQPSGPVDPGGNSENPRERGGNQLTQVPTNPDVPRGGSPDLQPKTMTPPSPEASLSSQTPPQPGAPTPVAGGPAAPIQPLKGPSPSELVNSPQLGQGMLGGAGGLLGGGLGVPGKIGGDDEDINQLLPLLMQLLGQ